MIDRRRIMLKEASGKAGPLYPFPERTEGRFAGTGGNIIEYSDERGGTRFIGVYNGTASTSSSAYNNKSKRFTIPAGAHVVMTVKVLEKHNTADVKTFITANSTTYAISAPSGSTVDTVYTVEKDFESDTDVGEFGVKWGGATPCGGRIEVTLTVDGVRYV